MLQYCLHAQAGKRLQIQNEYPMIGIEEIGVYIPAKKISNYSRKEKFDITEEFIKDKIGVERVAIKNHLEESSDLCVKAFENLVKKTSLNPAEIQVAIVVTQNPDYNLPHTSAIVHGHLGLPSDCACFDISLGCSGFVYALSIIQSFMDANKFTKGILFTADPYSKIIDPDDKNTSLIFGDAACATLLTDKPVYSTMDFTFGTMGKLHKDLICADNTLYMNGRAVYNFAARVITEDVMKILAKTKLGIDDIDRYLFHQGTKFIVDTLAKRLSLDPSKVVYDMYDYGNTVSSSIPILLEKELCQPQHKTILISGFGVGLSWSSAILQRIR